ncbi:MAG TPA: hypothetical protein VNO50_03805 [Pyrinomonadaceae bacterium]|nr:hypothetical protein [Pyrinomonadaceae bacterium]
MTRIKSILCAALVTLTVSTSAFAGDIHGRTGDIHGRIGDIHGLLGTILDAFKMVL